MRLVADEGVDRSVVVRLRDDGHEVIFIGETSRGAADSLVLGLAAESRSILVTSDKDFGERAGGEGSCILSNATATARLPNLGIDAVTAPSDQTHPSHPSQS